MAVAQPNMQVIVQQVVEYINLHILQEWRQQIVEEAQQMLAAAQPLSTANNDLLRHLMRVEEELKALGEQMDKRFEQMNLHFAEHREYMDKRFEAMDRRFAEQREDTNRRFVEQREYMDKRFEATDKRFEAMDRRFAEQREDTNRRFAEQREYMDRRFAEQREDITKNGKRITFFSTAIIAFVTASLVLLGIVLSRIGT